ncbi:protein trafficking Pga2 [Myxozyma melibiosi]|uniref:Protein trafficking Pga2 n=1 Tax=Myxozyma melibiosi TaxID=54550 RepID=A0ABR1FE00_9ASCO
MEIKIFDHLKDYTIKDYYPIFIIVTGYMLFRPYLMKIGAELQKREHRKAGAETREAAVKKALSLEDVDEQFEEETVKNVWGRNARKRQKNVMKQIEKRYERQAEIEANYESDEEIAEFLAE